MQFAPTKSAYLEQTAYGMISPKIVMTAVDTSKPVSPFVKSPIKMESPEFTDTFPKRIVHKRRFPLLLKGRILAALSASLASPSSLKGPLVSSSKFLTSSPNRPRLRPENRPDIIASMTITAKLYHSTSPGGSGAQIGTPSSLTYCSCSNLAICVV